MYLAGSVLSVSQFSAGRLIIEVMIDGAAQLIAYVGCAPRHIERGDYVVASDLQSSLDDKIVQCRTLNCINRSINAENRKAKNSSNNYLNTKKLEALRIRSLCIQHFQNELGAQGYLPVSSPAIVGRWPDGNTIPFSLDYYGSDARLSISNMIYQQIMVMHGFGKIYEIGKSFRNETPSRPNRLAEFTTFDITRATTDLRLIEQTFENLANSVHVYLSNQSIKTLNIPARLQFDRITYKELLRRCGVDSMPGAQLPPTVRTYIAENFDSYLWVTNFPEYSRPFYARSRDGMCDDSQLWYRGKVYVAAASVVEDDVDSYIPKIQARNHNVENFNDYLAHVKNGVPPMGQIATGIERMLATWFDDTDAADFCWFPRYGKNIAL